MAQPSWLSKRRSASIAEDLGTKHIMAHRRAVNNAPAGSAHPQPGTVSPQFVQQGFWKRLFKRPETGALGGAILVFILFFVVAPPFRQFSAFATVFYQSATIGIPAVAVSLLMIGGEFDLTAGVAVITSSLTASMFATQVAGNLWVGIGFALLVSLGIGALNGYLLVRSKLHSFLVTLSTFLMLQGLNIAITKLVTGDVSTGDISGLPGYESAHAIFASSFVISGVNISVAILFWILLLILATLVLLRTKFGNWVFAVGGSGDSARAVGVPVDKTKIALFMLVGFCAWLLGMHMLFEYNTVQSGAGVGNELLYIAAAVVGGCLMTGGYGSAIGSAFGAFIFGMTTEGVIYADWNPDWFMFFVGATLLIATIVNTWIRVRANGGK
jgi:simple sugar transport system permease protein